MENFNNAVLENIGSEIQLPNSDIWAQFDEKLEPFENNDAPREFTEIPEGEYLCKINSMTLKLTKNSNKPMVTTVFEIQSGDYVKRYMFYNQVIEAQFLIKIFSNFMTKIDPDFKFINYSQLAQYLQDETRMHIFSNMYLLINYYINDRGFSVYEIKSIMSEEGEEIIYNV